MSFYLVLALSIINASSVLAARMVLALYALEFGAQPFTIGLLAAAFSVFPILLSMPVGQLADRFGSRWLLAFAACAGTAGMLAPFLQPGLPAIFVATAMAGMSVGIYNVLLPNLTGLLSRQQNRTKIFSSFSLSRSVAHIIGPLVGGLGIDYLGYTNSCIGLALLMLIPVVLLALWGASLPTGEASVDHAMGGIRTLLADRKMCRLLATSSLLQTGQDLYAIYLPVYGHSVGLSASSIGMVLAMYPAAAFVVRLIMPRLTGKYSEQTILASAFFIGAASLVLIPFFTGALALGLISFLFGLGIGCSQPIILTLMFSNSAEGRSGETLGLRVTVTHITKLLGPVAFGSLGSAFGLLSMFCFSALMLGAGGILSRPTRRG